MKLNEDERLFLDIIKKIKDSQPETKIHEKKLYCSLSYIKIKYRNKNGNFPRIEKLFDILTFLEQTGYIEKIKIVGEGNKSFYRLNK